MKLALEQLEKLDECRWLIPKGTKPGMRTDALIYADEALLKQILTDLSLEQAINVAFLPGIVGRSLAMPDIHQGYGFPIGGVAATDVRTGVVSPGGVGFDINCGVRLLATSLDREEVIPRIKELVHQLFRDVPCGTGTKGPVRCSLAEIDDVLTRGARWVVVERGLGTPDDLECSEEEGTMAGADPEAVSQRALQRGAPQLGTLGSGNHFLEVQYVEKILDPEVAAAFGLRPEQIVVLIHCGSRGFGHQVCTDYLERMGEAMQRHRIELPDRQLACVPINSEEGRDYLGALACAAHFPRGHPHALTHFTPAPPPAAARPVLIPGSMGTASWVLVGAEGAMRETFGTVCHGAGRRMSRTAAKHSDAARNARQRLEEQSIYVKPESREGIAEEIPEAYKDVDAAVDVVPRAGLSKKVARLKPIGVIKG